jgi:hypothetical protein
MSKSQDITIKVGTPLASILTIIFVLFKLTGNIDWSWWWVFSPLWLPALLFIAIGVLIIVISLIASMFNR